MSVPNFNNLNIFADRLYWTQKFLFDFVIPLGASIGPSTHKRSYHFPFTFDQRKTQNDTREFLTKKGGKFLKIKEEVIGSYKISAVAYRDGHGKITLGISSQVNHHTHKQWDLHLKHPKDRKKILELYSFERNVLDVWLKNHNQGVGISNYCAELIIAKTEIQAVTTMGSDDCPWFLGRSLSFTSSTSDRILSSFIEAVGQNPSSTSDSNLTDLCTPIVKFL